MSGTRNILVFLAMFKCYILGQRYYMISILRSSFIALFLTAMPQAAHADPVDDLVQAEMAASNTPGVAISIIQEGKLMRAQGFGQADIELGVPVHSDTLFKTGATGMQLTAAAIMLLVEDGKLNLDAPVTEYLKGAPRKWHKVTVRQLLDHTSGLPATPNGDFRTDYTTDQLLAIIAAEDLNFAAGSRWRFSYAGYIVLGFVIEEITGEHWTKFVQQRLFAPLGMHSARGIDELAIIPNRSAGYEVRQGNLRNAEWISQTANSTADGSVYLSVLDYAAWARAVSQRQLLRPSSWKELAQPAKLNDGSTCAYSPGWFLSPATQSWWHSGSWQGFQTYALRYPGQDLTIAVFANGEAADVQLLARGLAAVVDPALTRVRADARPDADPATTARVRSLLEAIASGQPDYADYIDFARLDFDELTALYGGMVSELGGMEEFALFDMRKGCAETASRYRARYKGGIVEVRIGMTDNGKVSNLEMVPVREWNEPL